MAKLASAVVNQAKAWIGCKESDGSHKKIIDVYNSHKPLARGYAMKYTDAWCATFVSACAIKAGVTDILPTECGCEPMVKLFQGLGEWVENDAYIPKTGDVIFYDWDDSGSGDNTGWSDHVGIVESCDGKNIVVIEGNKSDAVGRRTLAVNGKFIRGFGVPKYDAETSSTPKATKTVDELAKEGINGVWGNGDARKKALTEAGYDYEAVQARVNEILKGTSTTPTQSTNITTDTAETIWNFLFAWLGNAFGVAGLMGNLYAESALKSTNLQNSYEKSLGLTDDQYTSKVDNGTYTNFVKDSAGYGLAQWTYWSRKQALLNYAKEQDASIGNLNMQLNFLKKEMTESYSSVLNTLKNAKTILEASNAVLTKFERPADQGATVQTKRASYGQTYYDKYAGKTSSAPAEDKSTSTTGQTTQTSKKVTASKPAYGFNKSLAGSYKTTAELNMRDGAGTSHKILTTLAKGLTVKNYGYYTDVNGVKWLYVQVTVSGVQYTGFCSSSYLQKV